MERKFYQLTEQQLRKCQPFVMPTDEEIKSEFAKTHHGKVTGWGMIKRDYALRALKFDAEYQRGIWQGRVDKANGLGYAEERNEKSFNLGYYRGFNQYESDRGGWDQVTQACFDSQYVRRGE